MFVIWDRLFGTYEPETEEVRYGITDQTGTMTILGAHLYGFRQLLLPLKYGKRGKELISFLLSQPSDVPDFLAGKTKIPVKQFKPADFQKSYVLTQVVLSALGLFYMIFWSKDWESSVKSICAIFICWGILSASIQWQKNIGLYFFQEGIRIILWGYFFYVIRNNIPVLSMYVMIACTSGIAFLYLRKLKNRLHEDPFFSRSGRG